jgi:hypothetical protein
MILRGAVVLQNSMDLVKREPGLCSETCDTPTGEGIGIKVEEAVINLKEEEVDPEPLVFRVLKTEDEVTCMSVCPLLCTSYIHGELANVFLMLICLSVVYTKCLHLESGFWRIVSKLCQEDCMLLHVACGIPLPVCCVLLLLDAEYSIK